MDNNCCKGKVPYKDRVGIYLTDVSRLNKKEIETTLMSEFNFTSSQIKTIIKFVDSRGECVIWEGKSSDAIDKVAMLNRRGIKCYAKSNNLLK